MRLIALAACPLICIAVAAPAAQAQTSASAGTSCKTLLTKSKKAARAGQKAKAKRLRTRHRACTSSAAVRAALAGYTFTGTRGDGEWVVVTLCTDGTWESRTGSQPVAVSTGTNWYVRETTFSSLRKWSTQVGEHKDRRKGGWGVGVARSGDSFQVGIAAFDGVADLGPVTRTPAGCG